MRFPRGMVRERDAARRLPRFQNSKGAPRRSTSGERGWIESTVGPKRKVGQGKSVRA